MNMNKETQQKIQEIQILDQNLQNILMQKQTFQLELNETVNAIEEVKNTEDTIYKILGQVMIKSEKEKVLKDLEEKKKLFELRLGALEKQEKLLGNKARELQFEAEKLMKQPETKK